MIDKGNGGSKVTVDLALLAHRSMVENGFTPEFAPAVMAEVHALSRQPPEPTGDVLDMRGLLWSSIDNDESKDLDQIEVAERRQDGSVRIRVAIADVDALVRAGSEIDRRAGANTTSVYTGVSVFPMLPFELSTDLTSLNESVDRFALVVEMDVAPDGTVTSSDVHRAIVRNHAQLAYDSVGAWLAGKGPPPPKVAANAALAEQLKIQDEVARKLQAVRYKNGALDLETLEARPVLSGTKIVDLALTQKSRARDLIEDFMISSNGAMARFLESRGRSSIRRVVKSPERWQRIVALAGSLGESLPNEASSVALAQFLTRRKAADAAHFADLSLSIVKLMGPGEYALERAGGLHVGHFGLAVQDYTHSTAPNRRYADLITQRLIKAAIANTPPPYSDEALGAIAERCTLKEDGARKVERFMRKAAAALFLASRIGEVFDAIVTGASPKGTFVRLIKPPAEGRIVRGEAGLDVGDAVRVKLVATEPSRGFIDFEKVI